MRARLSLTLPQRWPSALAANAVLLVVAVGFALPLAWLVLATIDPRAGLSVRVPSRPTLANLGFVLADPTTLGALWNSTQLAGATALLTAALAALAAYPLSRHNLPFKQTFLYTILFASALPITAIIVPAYELFVKVGDTLNFQLIDQIPATVLLLSATYLPFSIWIMKNFMDGVPVELEQAAWVDGASPMRSLRHIVLPLTAPGFALTALLAFVHAWSIFIVPFILLLSAGKQPMAVGIFGFFDEQGQANLGYVAAYASIYTLPIVALYLILSRHIGGAFRLGGAVTG